MHIQTHILSGWCVGNTVQLAQRERFLCMLAATLPDLDGLGILVSQKVYWDYHHTACHNVFAGLLISAVLTFFSQNRLKAFAVYLSLFHLHLLLDFFGSGPGWYIVYLWPFSGWLLSYGNAWEFFSWQNFAALYAFAFWTLYIAFIKKRTPLEYFLPKTDRKAIDMLLLLGKSKTGKNPPP
ncbi:metal-dependent hydrolase [Thermodesulfobacteriota bacterium]